MKEIWMEKLVMLLDIYEEEVVGVHSVWEHITEKDEAWIISKKFWFIQRLVEQDKIDWSKIHIYSEPYYDLRDYQTDILREIDRDEELLMLLPIQDEPIEFLISILKNV